MKAQDLQNKYLTETQEHHINEQGETDLDYVIWLEDNLIKSVIENENKDDEIVVLKSKLIVSDGWIEYYKKKRLFNKLGIKIKRNDGK